MKCFSKLLPLCSSSIGFLKESQSDISKKSILLVLISFLHISFVSPNLIPNLSADNLTPNRNLEPHSSLMPLIISKIILDLFSKLPPYSSSLLLNSEHFEKIGKFDERYFLFWEEIDLCRRFRSKKHSVIVSPNSLAVHKQGHSSKKNIKNFIIKTFYSEYSPLIYFNVKKLSSFLIYKQIRYLFRSVTYLLILNVKKSFINLIKLYANIKYFFDLRSS